MNFIELVKARQSVRSYLDKPVEREKIERCLEAARLAASSRNTQPWEYLVVEESELREKLARTTFSNLVDFNRFSLNAPVLLVLLSWQPVLNSLGAVIRKRQSNLFDAGLSAANFCLQASEEGLGTCMMGWFQVGEVKKLLKIRAPKKPILIISLGYPARPDIREKKRKSLDEIRKYVS